MLECSFDKFADFILRKERFKKNLVRTEMNKGEYQIVQDFYARLRTRLKYLLKHGYSLDGLDELLEKINPKKLACYETSINCIKDFLSDKEYMWVPTIKANIQYANLLVIVSPQIALNMPNGLHFIRIHFTKDPIKPEKVKILHKIMQDALHEEVGEIKLTVWDIQRCRFYTADLNEEIKISYDFEKEADSWVKYAEEDM